MHLCVLGAVWARLLISIPEKSIGATGFEPATLCSDGTLATKLRHSVSDHDQKFQEPYLVPTGTPEAPRAPFMAEHLGDHCQAL